MQQAPRRGGHPRAPGSDGEIPAGGSPRAIERRTALVCAHDASCSGHRHDVGAIAEAAHAAGALVLLPTATRRAGRSSSTSARSARTSSPAGPSSTCSGRPVSVSCGSGPRCGRRSSPRLAGSRTRTSSPCRSRTTRRTGARRRFDSGTPPVPALYAGVAGLSLVQEVEFQAIEAHVRGLVDRLLDGLSRSERRCPRRATRHDAGRSCACAPVTTPRSWQPSPSE